MTQHHDTQLGRRVASFVLVVMVGGLAAVLSALPACYPNSPENFTELDVVATFFDDTEDFGANKNYFLLDSVLHIVGTDSVPISRDQDSLILATVATNMDGLNYNRVGTSPQADVVMVVSATATNNYQGFVSYPCCGAGWGWWWP